MHALLYKYATWVSRFERGTQAEGYPRTMDHIINQKGDIGLGECLTTDCWGRYLGLKGTR